MVRTSGRGLRASRGPSSSGSAEDAHGGPTRNPEEAVGAGPTGLVLSLWLTRMGVRERVVDKAPHAGHVTRRRLGPREA